MRLRLSQLIVLLLLTLVLLQGCGGGSGSGSVGDRGSVEFTIVWPPAGRVIPSAAQSILIRVISGAQTVASKLIPRPPAGTNTSSVRFDSLSIGVVTVLVDAYPNPDGTGVIQASGGITVAIIPGQTTQAVIDPASTVDHIDLIPNPVKTLKNRSVTLVVSPRNAVNALVLVAQSSLSFSTANPAIATVDVNGVVSGVALGVTTVQVVDTESGHTAQANVQVVPPIVVDPPQAVITLSDSVQFTATVTLLASPNVTWKIAEDNGDNDVGSVDNTGNYTASSKQPGTFHVVATSVSDPTLSASSTVIVQSGIGTVIIK